MFSLAYFQISVTLLVISGIYCDYCKLTWNPIPLYVNSVYLFIYLFI